jgi:transposase
MHPIVLTSEQRREVERRRKKTLDRRIYQRLTAVLTVAAGHSPDDIAHLLGVDLTQLSQWLRVFRNEGLESLFQKP